MRAGNLDTPADLLELDVSLQPIVLDWIWVGITSKELGELSYAMGIRNPAKITIRAWWDERLIQGRYLRADGRLFHLDSVRDFDNQRAEVVITATEFVGRSAEYQPAGEPPRACRVFLLQQAPYKDELGQVTDYKILAEVALIETGRIQVDDVLSVGDVDYQVIAYADDTDDGIVRGLWLEVQL